MDNKRAVWLEWACYNIARGSTIAEVAGEMRAFGFAAPEVDEGLKELKCHPAYQAAQRLGRDVAKLISLNNALLELERQSFNFKTLQRTVGLSGQEFHDCYYVRNRPVIIEDVVGGWPALQKWNLEFLRSRFGNENVAFQRGRSLHDHRDSFVEHTTEAPFSEFLDLMAQPNLGEAPPYLIAHDRQPAGSPVQGKRP